MSSIAVTIYPFIKLHVANVCLSTVLPFLHEEHVVAVALLDALALAADRVPVDVQGLGEAQVEPAAGPARLKLAV